MCFHLDSNFISNLIVTLIGSFTGVYLAIIASRIQEQRHNKILLLFFSKMMDSIVSHTKKQIENVKDLSIRLKEKPLEIHLIGMIATLEFERVKSIDSITLTKTYNHYFKKNPDEFNKALAYIDYLGIAIKEFFSRNEKHINFIHNDKIFVRDQIELLIYHIGMYVMEIEQNNNAFISDPDYKFLSPYMNRLSELTRNKNNDLSIYEDDILTPLNNTLLHDLTNRPTREQLFQIVKQAKNRLDGIRFNSIEFANSLVMDFEIIEKALKFLEMISIKIKER